MSDLRAGAWLTGIVLASAGASAQSVRPTSLEWSAPPDAGCAERSVLAARVTRRLGHPAFVPDAQADDHIVGRVERRGGGGWIATVEVRDAAGDVVGRRTLAEDDARCGALDEAIELVLALMLDPNADLSAPSPARDGDPNGSAPPPSAATGDPHPPPRRALASSRGGPPRAPPTAAAPLSSGPFVELALGFLTQPEVGVGGALGLRQGLGDGWAAELRGAIYAPTFARAAEGDAGAEVIEVDVGLALCPPLRASVDAVSIEACVESVLELLVARGFGFDVVREVVEPLLGVGASLRGALAVAPELSLTARFAAAGAVLRTRLVGRDADDAVVELWPAPYVLLYVTVGAQMRFW